MERVALFRSLFVGRDDGYAQRWERDGRKGWYPQLERLPGQTWQEAKEARRYPPLTDDVLHDHLSGEDQRRADAQSYVQPAETAGVPTAVGVSRSGQAAHVWTFFSEPVPALDARALGSGILVLRDERWSDRRINDTFAPCPGARRWPRSARWPASNGA
ncbi:TOTE conflict system archaeo-eukaryotic primase domain-containing protein [Micromonospora yasonensis]|uniref:TOTE conflict system archaeo-eukaryotic primase domain-containing protein n=1 Tax=Micromonospora yasonensis TaxID=1128667 RepID=UPI003872B79A